MNHLAKILVRETVLRLPYLRDEFFEWEFLRREQSFKGIYPSFSEAVLDSPAGKLVGYNHKEIATIDEKRIDHLNPADYPVLFWLSPLLPQAKVVFELGGNIGVAYYAYRKYVSFPDHLHWVVCEVPEMASAGRELARKKDEKQLSFTDKREKANHSDIYFTSGALQYIEEPFAQILEILPIRPRNILINRIPLCDGPSFITLQNNGAWIVPYKVSNQSEFIRSIVLLGYELVDHWKIARSLEVLMNPQYKVENYQGMYFRLKQEE